MRSRGELARRRLGYGRGARMAFEQDEVEIIGGLRHGVTLGSPVAIRVGNSEWPKWQTVMAADPVDPEELAEQARNAPLTRPRPGPRRPGRHAEVRPHRRPADPGAGQRPGDRRPGRRRHRGQGAAAAGARHRDRVARGGAGLGGREARAAADARGRRADRRRPAALPRPGGERPDGRRGRRGEEGRGHPRRHRRGAGVRGAAGSGQPRAVGPQARRAAGDRADVDPGDQGRGDRRRRGSRPARGARRRTTRSCRPRPGCVGSPTGPAGWRAASPPASRCGCARR